MKKTFKKLSALILAVAMVMALGMTTFAVTPDDTAELKITGIEKDATVTLYQIGTPEYNTKGDTFVKFNYVSPINVKDDKNKIAVPFTEAGPKTDEINTIANGIVAETITASVADTMIAVGADGVYKYDAKAGVYIAIITGGKNTYNPILLAASYSDKGTLSGGEIKVTSNYLYGDKAVAKSSEPTIKKEIDGGTTPDADAENNAKPTVSVGDIVSYKVTPTLPSYPANAVNKTVYITDTMTSGLDFDFASLTVKLGTDDEVTRENTKTTITTTNEETKEVNSATFKSGDKVIATAIETANGFRLSFVYDEVNGKTPSVEYQARVNENAIVGVAGNPNDVDYFYSNQPNTGTTYEDLKKEPQEGDGLKKKEDKVTVYTYEIAFKKTGEGNDAEKLAGATFGIYKTKKANTDGTVELSGLVDIVVSNSDGIARSSQVEKGTYYVQEISAPSGYSLNTTIYEVEAKWTSVTSTVTDTVTKTTYTSDKEKAKSDVQVGWLKDNVFYSMDTYTTETAAKADAVPAYVATENTTTSTSIETEKGPGAGVVNLGVITNTKMSELPSTGGIGTYIFTIVGVVIMVVAGALFFTSRKKRA